MNNRPKVSILLPTYNEENSVKETIESILSQTYNNFELLVLDASTDETPDIVKKIKDKRLQLIRTEKGISTQLNIGIKKARGDYIARMDADCIAAKTRIEKQVNYLDKNSEVGIVGTWAKFVLPNKDLKFRKDPVEDINIKKRLIKTVAFVHPTIMVRSEIYDKTNGYIIPSLRCEDYYFYVKSISYTKFHNLPEVLLTKREEKAELDISFHLRKLSRILKCSTIAFLNIKKPQYLLIWIYYNIKRTILGV